MTNRDLAALMGHKSSVIEAYEELKHTTMKYNNEHIAELDIIYFLRNILWSANFELIAKIIDDYGMESRLDQWKQALEKLRSKPIV